jgi:hypothetical protein
VIRFSSIMRSFFDQVQAVLAGTTRLPLDAGGTKLLHFMLERNEGCDVTMMPDTFHIQYGWHLAYHRYDHDLAPRVVSWLCDAAPAGYLPAGALPWWFEVTGDTTRDTFVHDGVGMVVRSESLGPCWMYGPHRLWFDHSPGRVVIMIRDATIDPGPGALPPPIEPPIEYITGERPCPHCGVVPERYRRLRGGGLVCLACGSSSA